MSRIGIDQIRDRIRFRQYDMTAHAMEEMAEDGLDIVDIETAVLNGHIARIEKDDPRGTKYVVEGLAANQYTHVGVVGRFPIQERFLIVTVYEINEAER